GNAAEATWSLVAAFKGAVTARQRWARQLRDSANPGTADLVRRLREVNLAMLRLALADNLPVGPPRPRHSRAEVDDLRELGERRGRLERQLALASPAFRRLMEQPSRGAAGIRGALRDDVALIDFVEYRHVSPSARPREGY